MHLMLVLTLHTSMVMRGGAALAGRRLSSNYWHAAMWQRNRDQWYNRSLNKQETQDMICQRAYRRACPVHRAIPSQNRSERPWPRAVGGGLLFFSMAYGHLTNCHIALNFARWLAELLGKSVVVPLCTDGDGCFAKLRMTNLTAIWQPSSFGGCHSTAHSPAVSSTPRTCHTGACLGSLTAPNLATCLGLTPNDCAGEVSADPKLSRSLVLSGFTHYTLPTLAAASLNGECEQNGTRDWKTLVVNERCRNFVASGGCEPYTSRNQTSLKGLWRGLGGPWPLAAALSSSKAHSQPSTACPRACAEHAYPDVPEGNVYIAHLFPLAMGLHDSWRLCDNPVLSKRPRMQAAEIRATLPERFVCMHWRAGDFLLKRGSPSAAALANSSKIAKALRTVASAVGATSALVLSNVDDRLGRLFTAELQGTLAVKMSRCSDTPPDAEKTVCADAVALLLSRRSTFSKHILALAAPSTRYSYLGYCPATNGSSWLACAGAK